MDTFKVFYIIENLGDLIDDDTSATKALFIASKMRGELVFPNLPVIGDEISLYVLGLEAVINKTLKVVKRCWCKVDDGIGLKIGLKLLDF